jgi:hypothetical protein
MKTTLASILLVAGILAIAGCASTKTKIETSSISARTFSFVSSTRPLPEFAAKEKQVHELVQNAITESLARRHITRVDQGGDIIVAYLIITGDNVSTASINDYFGYGRDAQELLNVAHDKYTGSKVPYHFEAGTLLIDIIDGKTFKVLKRGYASRNLQKDVAPEARAQRMNDVVEEILAGTQFNP